MSIHGLVLISTLGTLTLAYAMIFVYSMIFPISCLGSKRRDFLEVLVRELLGRLASKMTVFCNPL
jgi:hypothetical protein